jgi:hypothetical protein
MQGKGGEDTHRVNYLPSSFIRVLDQGNAYEVGYDATTGLVDGSMSEGEKESWGQPTNKGKRAFLT